MTRSSSKRPKDILLEQVFKELLKYIEISSEEQLGKRIFNSSTAFAYA